MFRFEQRIAKLEDLLDGSDGVIAEIRALKKLVETIKVSK